jgi:hypothetical protein
MSTDINGPWAGTPCTSDLWPYTRSLADFEARRSVGQLVRTYSGLSDSPHQPDVISYIRAAKLLKESEVAASAINSCVTRVNNAQRALVSDPAQWQAVITWVKTSNRGGAANYSTQVMYIYFMMYLLRCAVDFFLGAFIVAGDDCEYTADPLELLYAGGDCLREFICLMCRDDITETLLPVAQEGSPGDRPPTPLEIHLTAKEHAAWTREINLLNESARTHT